MSAIVDSCESLLLREISEPEHNKLRLLLIEGIVNSEAESVNFAGTILEGVHRVQFLPESRALEITWNSYVAYLVTNESYSIADEMPHCGRWLRRYSESPFLQYLKHA